MNCKFSWIVVKTVLDFPRREQWLAPIDKVHLSSALIPSAAGWIRLHLPLRAQRLAGRTGQDWAPSRLCLWLQTQSTDRRFVPGQTLLDSLCTVAYQVLLHKKVGWQKNKSWCFRVKGKPWCLTCSRNMPPRLPAQNLGWKQTKKKTHQSHDEDIRMMCKVQTGRACGKRRIEIILK